MTRPYLYALLLLPALVIASPADAALHASVDNTQVAPGDTVQLTLAHDGQTNTQPDLTPLKQDFDVLGRSSSSNLQIINGKVSSTTQLELSLAPKHTGQVIIPSLTWGSDRSAPLTLNVAAAANGAKGGAANGTVVRKVFLETEVDPKSPYVQAAVHMTVRIYAAVPLSHGNLEFSGTDAVLVRQAGPDSNSTTERNGQSYQVVTRHYLIFPQHSGRLDIPGPTLSGNIPTTHRADPSDPFSGFPGSPFGDMLTASRPISLHGDPVVLDVRPRPRGAGASYWLPARNVSLQADWRPSKLQGHVGDPMTLDLHLRAEGLTAAQLPDLSTLTVWPEGLKAYPDTPKLKDLPQGNDVAGDREQSIALIADQPGHFTIPALQVSWWDTQTNQTREATLPAQTLVIEPLPGSSVSTPAPTHTAQTAAETPPDRRSATSAPTPSDTGPESSQSAAAGSRHIPWPWICLGLALLWIATLIAWLRTNRRGGTTAATATSQRTRPSYTDVSSLRTAFRAACQTNDAFAARRSLLLWANAAWDGPRIPGLNALAKLINAPEAATLLQALDRACYAQDAWNGEALAKVLTDLPFRKPAAIDSPRDLAPLYPT